MPRPRPGELDASTLPLKTCAQLARELSANLAAAQAEADRYERLLDAYLCAAGLSQLLDDHIDRDATGLRRLGGALSRMGVGLAPAAGRGLLAGGALIDELRKPLVDRAALACAARADGLARALADVLVGPGGEIRELVASSRMLDRQVGSLPTRVRESLARLPACFFGFDLRPEDCDQVAGRFATAFPDRPTRLLVVGVRTSGTYLAPLTAAHLVRRGFGAVDTVSWRPGGRWSRRALHLVRSVLDADGIAAVVDDPPTTGESLARTCEELVRLGFPAARVVPFVFSFATPPRQPWRRRLAAYRPIVVPQRCWASHRRLRSPEVEEALSSALTGRSVTVTTDAGTGPTIRVAGVGRARRLRVPANVDLRKRRSPRAHLRALFQVELTAADGRSYSHLVEAVGVGVGLFGRLPVVTARRLAGWVPEVYGATSGICFRAWTTPGRGLVAVGGQWLEGAVDRVAGYVAARQRRLAVPDDTTLKLLGRGTLWDRCRHLLAPAFGRAAVLGADGLRGHYGTLLGADPPSLVDGGMSPLNWFVAAGGSASAGLVKAHPDDETFWSGAPLCQDGAFDLASAAVEFGAWGRHLGSSVDFDSRLRNAYTCETGARIDAERWLLLKLLHLQTCRQRHFHDHQRSGGRPDADPRPAARFGLHCALGPLEAEMSECVQRYWAETLFEGQSASRRDDFCAIDIDGVLETPGLGFPALTPAGAAALWSLAHHGYGVVLASGRSLDEVRSRCRSYRLAGGVAEYGGAWYDHAAGRTGSLLTKAQRADLDDLRRSLPRVEAWLLAGFEHSVRAYTIQDGRRRGLSEEQIERALAGCGAGSRVRVIRGRQQTDFVPAGIDKAAGLHALLRQLRPRGDRPLAAGVGDTVSDLPMLQMAASPFAPANADGELRAAAPDAGIRILGRPNQAGLALAVAALIGHRPGSCDACRLPAMSGRGEFLMRILGAQDAGPLGKAWRALTIGVGAGRRP